MQERLNRLYEQYGYRKFKMSRFEDYDLYAQNRDFLRQDRIITLPTPTAPSRPSSRTSPCPS